MTYQNNSSAAHGDAPRLNAARQKRELRRLGNLSGAGILLFVIFQFICVFFLVVVGLENRYSNDPDFYYAIGTLVSVFCIFIPFLIIWLLLGKKRGACLNFGKPYDPGMMAAAVPIGLMICMVGNFSTYYLSVFFERAFGIIFTAPEMPSPTGAAGIVAYILQIAFVPALVEEFAVRGVVMVPLRKYGNRFAIIVSSAIFGIMHGNLVQAPFAFIVGMGIGYLVITTGSLWTGVLIHFFNNLFSAVITLLYDFIPEQSVNIIYYVCVAVFLASGVICTLIFLRRASGRHIPVKLGKPAATLKTGSKLAAYLINIPMILAIIYLLFSTASYISFTG